MLAPIAPGRSNPIGALPEFEKRRCPFFSVAPWNEATQAVPSPVTTTWFSGSCSKSASTKQYGFTSFDFQYSGSTTGYLFWRTLHHSSHSPCAAFFAGAGNAVIAAKKLFRSA